MADGRIRVYCLGLTLDALALAGDLLTVWWYHQKRGVNATNSYE